MSIQRRQLIQASTSSTLLDSLALSAMVPVGGSPDEMARSMKFYYDLWGPLVKKIGFTADS